MRVTLLGTGNAGQMPVYNCNCRACGRARADTRFRRGPCCALVETSAGRWLIDAGLHDIADRFPPGTLSGILLTHYHADHAQGLLPLRWGVGLRIPVLGPADPDGLADLFKHPGILDFSRKLTAFEPVKLSTGLSATPLPLNHSKPTLGYLFEADGGRVAYLTDTVGLPDATRDFLLAASPDVIVLDCSEPPADAPPRNHNDLTRAKETIAALKPAQAVFTHVGHELDAYVMEQGDAVLHGAVLARDGYVIELT